MKRELRWIGSTTRRGFLGGAAKGLVILVVAPRVLAADASAIAPGEAAASPRPMAPLGPPPLCTVPRGWERVSPAALADPELFRAEHERIHAAAAPFDYGKLWSFATFAEEELGRWPRTWGELVHGWSRWHGWEGFPRREFAKFGAEQVERAGLRLQDAPPTRDVLEELGARCSEWRRAEGRFADGCGYRTPLEARWLSGFREPLRQKFVDEYERVGAPWGHGELAAGLYIWTAAERQRRDRSRPGAADALGA